MQSIIISMICHLQIRTESIITFTKKFLLACQDAATWKMDFSTLFDDSTPLIL